MSSSFTNDSYMSSRCITQYISLRTKNSFSSKNNSIVSFDMIPVNRYNEYVFDVIDTIGSKKVTGIKVNNMGIFNIIANISFKLSQSGKIMLTCNIRKKGNRSNISTPSHLILKQDVDAESINTVTLSGILELMDENIVSLDLSINGNKRDSSITIMNNSFITLSLVSVDFGIANNNNNN